MATKNVAIQNYKLLKQSFVITQPMQSYIFFYQLTNFLQITFQQIIFGEFLASAGNYNLLFFTKASDYNIRCENKQNKTK